MSKMMTKPSEVEMSSQTLLRAADCARLCGVSRRTWFRLSASARTPACVRVGASPRWRRGDMELWIGWNCCSRQEFEARKQAEQK